MQAIRIIDINAKYIKKINTRLFDKIILIYTHEIYIIIMYAKIIDNSYWPFKRKKVRVVQFGSFLNHPYFLYLLIYILASDLLRKRL